MPLRDYFHPPLTKRTSWEGVHGGWPMVIVQQLGRILPDTGTSPSRGYTSVPKRRWTSPHWIK